MSNLGTPIGNGYGGLNWNNWYVLDTSIYGNGVNGYAHGLVSSPNVAYNSFGGPATFSAASGAFTLDSFYLTAAWNNNLGALCKSRQPMILYGLHGDDSLMSRRCFAQSSFADAFVKAYSKAGGFLEDLQQTIEWSAFDVLFAQINANTKGAPGYPPLTMFRIVLLQQWYNLSDPQAEEAVRDRMSFRRFCGIPLDAETPDHSSIWRFRQTIEKLERFPLAWNRESVQSPRLMTPSPTVARR